MLSSLRVGARPSQLSKAQVEEVLVLLQSFHPEMEFDYFWVKTVGDRDQLTSLRTLGKTDFFTKEIDDALLEGKCRIAIHSAKDLPDPLTPGLTVVALTKGVDPSDSLVLREGETFDSLPRGAKIATSSFRREEMVATMRSDLSFVDIRGDIISRLEKLYMHQVDGVVIAEAALIRLKKTHLNRILLKGETAPLQGKLAVVAREGDEEMEHLFSSLIGC